VAEREHPLDPAAAIGINTPFSSSDSVCPPNSSLYESHESWVELSLVINNFMSHRRSRFRAQEVVPAAHVLCEDRKRHSLLCFVDIFTHRCRSLCGYSLENGNSPRARNHLRIDGIFDDSSIYFFSFLFLHNLSFVLPLVLLYFNSILLLISFICRHFLCLLRVRLKTATVLIAHWRLSCNPEKYWPGSMVHQQIRRGRFQ
jgi:hypothetical protein